MLRTLVLAALVLLAPLEAAEMEEFHPQDGPDVDLRIEVAEDRVTVEVGLNLAFVDEILEPAREEFDALHEIEARGMREPLMERLRGILGIQIDGVAVTPVVVDYTWAEADPLLVPLFTRCGARALIQVRTTLEFPAKSPPGQVAIGWNVFPPDIAIGQGEDTPPIEIRALLSAGTEELWIGLSMDQPQFVWSGSLEPRSELYEAVPARSFEPAVAGLFRRSLILAGALAFLVLGMLLLRRVPLLAWPSIAVGIGACVWVARSDELGQLTLEPAEALAVFRPLHANIYRAFDYDSESDVYDALARSVDGELLDRLYDQIYSGLVLVDDGGAVCKIKRVEILEAEVGAPAEEAPPGAAFDVTARWTVAGQVHHWGHSHSRTNEYRARYTVVGRGADWRIADSQILEQRRLEAAPLEPLRGDNDFEVPEEL